MIADDIDIQLDNDNNVWQVGPFAHLPSGPGIMVRKTVKYKPGSMPLVTVSEPVASKAPSLIQCPPVAPQPIQCPLVIPPPIGLQNTIPGEKVTTDDLRRLFARKQFEIERIDEGTTWNQYLLYKRYVEDSINELNPDITKANERK